MIGKGINRVLSIAAAISFFSGYVIAIVAGVLWPTNEPILIALLAMGFLVGFLNITGREIMPYLVAAIALIVIGTTHPFNAFDRVNHDLVVNINDVTILLALFTAPAALVQAIRAGITLSAPGDQTS